MWYIMLKIPFCIFSAGTKNSADGYYDMTCCLKLYKDRQKVSSIQISKDYT